MEDITNADYAHRKGVCKDFKFKRISWGVCSKQLFLADVFENLWNMSSGIWNLPSSFFIALGLAWQGAFKKTKAKLDFWTNIDKLLMVKKVSQEELCHFYSSLWKS